MDDKKLMWDRFCRLGDMIGEGLHYEEPWIEKDYKHLSKILLPPTEEEKQLKKQIRQSRNKSIDEQIKEKLKTDRCSCKKELKQTRSGSKTVVCECGKRFRYKRKKR